MDTQVTSSWGTMTALQRKQQILEVAENYVRSLQEFTGKEVKLTLSFVSRPTFTQGVEDATAVFTIEAEL